jgi:hypothetical protein
MSDPATYVDFCGEVFEIPEGGNLTVGREADVMIDENQFLHRRFLEFSQVDGMVWVANVGTTLTATLADERGLAQTWLSPGARLPIVFPRTAVWFTAGPTTYELEVVFEGAPFVATPETQVDGGESTIGRPIFTPDQRLLILALAEDVLRRGNRGAGAIPPSAAAADRLGWSITKFNRKLDNVCAKLAKLGVRGLVMDGVRNASNRRARLVEYSLASRLVTVDDLEFLDGVRDGQPGETQFQPKP